jgi:lipoyl(octanoyl) transferase
VGLFTAASGLLLRSASVSTIETQPELEIDFRDLGRMSYADAYAMQKAVQHDVISRRLTEGGDGCGMTVLFVEHDPAVITISRRPGASQHLIATEAQLRAAGVEVAQTDRGGDITYHGPGQLVVYPILDLNRLDLRLNSYLRFLEQIVIDVLARFGIQGDRDETATGVWVRPRPTARPEPGSPAKIAAIGVRVSRWVTMHGLALNVTTNLDHFNLIVPCGLVGRNVTSMQRELADACPRIDQVKHAVAEQFRKALAERIAD